MSDTQAVIEVFKRIARPEMRRFMPANSCIGAARTTIEIFRLFGIDAVEIPVRYVFAVPALKYMRVGGFSAEDRAAMQRRCASWHDESGPDGQGWDGHLVVFVAGRWLIDAAIDQADAPQFGVSVPMEVACFDTDGHDDFDPNASFQADAALLLDSGERVELIYRTSGDLSYADTPAWNDEGLPLLALRIAIKMRKQLRRTK